MIGGVLRVRLVTANHHNIARTVLLARLSIRSTACESRLIRYAVTIVRGCKNACLEQLDRDFRNLIQPIISRCRTCDEMLFP
jgi:hypothetical protein